MKKIYLVLLLLLAPAFVSAEISQNLYYGLTNNGGVKELQQYLIGKGFLTGQATGNFYSLTLSAVKKYQANQKINPTGYVGPLTRQAINSGSAVVQTPASNPPSGQITTGLLKPAPLTGTLELSRNSAYPDQKITAPQIKFKLADFLLKNNTSEAVNLKKIQIDLAVGSNLYVANQYITKLYIAYGSEKTAAVSTVSHNNYFLIDYQLPVGQTIDLSLFGDVNSSIPLSSTINSGALVTGKSAVSATAVGTNLNAVLASQNITFGSSSLSVSQDSSTPQAKIVANSQKIIAGKFKFTASGDSYNISNLKFVVPCSQNVLPILDARLSDTTTQASLSSAPAPAIYDGKNYIFDFTTNTPVILNSSVSVTLSYNLGATINSSGTNINIAPILTYVRAVDSKGKLFDGAAVSYNNMTASYGGIALPDAGITVNSIYTFRSMPTFTAVSSNASITNGSNADLYTFSIGADQNGDIAVKQIIFSITITDANKSFPHLNDFKFFKGNTDYTGAVLIGNDVNNSYSSLINIGIGYGTSSVVVTFNDEEVIPAGKTQTYILKATANNFIKNSSGADSISTSIPQDTAVSSNGKYLRMAFTNIYGLAKSPTDISVAYYNLLWSDKSALGYFPHSGLNNFSTNDWYNGFRVSNFPLSAQTITAQ